MNQSSILGHWKLQPPTCNNAGHTTVTNIKTDKEYKQPRKMKSIRGVFHPPFIQEDALEAQRSKLTFRPTDIFVTTYSKCGTTLTEQIVCLLLNGGRSEGLNPLDKNTLDKHSGAVGKIWVERAVVDGLGIENNELSSQPTQNDSDGKLTGEMKTRMSVEEFNAVPSPRLLKTHEPVKLFLDRRQVAKVLYVTRNPFDACVSCYYHPKKGLSPQSLGMPFEGFAKLWLSELMEFGGWIQHTNGWWKEHQRRKDTMLWMSYEELVREPLDSIRKIASFIGVDTTADSTLVQRVADGCKFDNVKKRAQASLDSGAQGSIDHLRLGKVGDWRNHFSKELYDEFEHCIRLLFNGVGTLEYDIGDGETWEL